MEILESLGAGGSATDRHSDRQAGIGADQEGTGKSRGPRSPPRNRASPPGPRNWAAGLNVAERELPGEILERYRRLVKNHGADALAVLENKSCSACYTKLSPQDVVNVNMGKFVFCRACGRLLYRAGVEDRDD